MPVTQNGQRCRLLEKTKTHLPRVEGVHEVSIARRTVQHLKRQVKACSSERNGCGVSFSCLKKVQMESAPNEVLTSNGADGGRLLVRIDAVLEQQLLLIVARDEGGRLRLLRKVGRHQRIVAARPNHRQKKRGVENMSPPFFSSLQPFQKS